ncbi:major facilitator superfamily domain-containing protein [Apiospora marii]|uniref:major facilitator superfamily domain-containing protein n=1 Tax=Apiospora marii TaxID=335849 RepID=UPI003130E435
MNPVIPTAPLDLDENERPKARTKLRLYAILAALYLSLFIAALDQTIVSIAIPTITSDLHSAQGYVWIGGAYLLANAATGPIWAKCSDIWGRKPLLLAAVALFTAASLLAALSVSMTMLIAGRALQGVASGGMMQLVTIVISDLFSVRERSLYQGYVGFVWALAGSSGPLLGGAFTQFDWRWSFWINLPIGGLTFLLLALFLDVHNPRTRLGEGIKAIDWIGTVSILAVAVLLLLGLDFGGAIFPWNSPKVICLIVVGGLMIGFFVFGEHRLARYPIIPLAMFKNGSNNATFLSVLQASPLKSGILMLPLIGTMAIMEILTGVVIHRTGRYQEILWVGAALMTLGTGLYVTFGPATACLCFLRNVASALSVVLGGVVFQNSMEARQGSLAAAGLDGSVRRALSGSQAAANVGITQTITDGVQRHVVLEAFAWSMRNMFIMYTCLSGVALVASAFIKHRKLNEEHTETRTGIESLTKAG